MSVFFVPAGLRHSAAYLTVDAEDATRPRVDLRVDMEVTVASRVRPYRIVCLEAAIENGDTGHVERELTGLAERLATVMQRYTDRGDNELLLTAFLEAADAVDAMQAHLHQQALLRRAFYKLETAEEHIAAIASRS